MRVIAGSARRTPLKCIEGESTRPTTDRIKETLFNMISQDLWDCRFLDLFSGSGAIAIEALSRGAKKAVLVEKNPAAVRCIRENLEKTHLAEGARVMQSDVLSALHRLSGSEDPFDIIFMDPPYDHGLEMQVLKALQDSSLIREDTLIIIEASLETSFDDLNDLGFETVRIKKYKTNQHVFVQKAGVNL